MARVEIDRDRYGRPLVVPPSGGKPVAYTRATTIANSLDDASALVAWKMRMAAIGLTTRPDILLSITAAQEDKMAVNSKYIMLPSHCKLRCRQLERYRHLNLQIEHL